MLVTNLCTAYAIAAKAAAAGRCHRYKQGGNRVYDAVLPADTDGWKWVGTKTLDVSGFGHVSMQAYLPIMLHRLYAQHSRGVCLNVRLHNFSASPFQRGSARVPKPALAQAYA